MKSLVRIASGQGFWGDWLEAPRRQVEGGPVDYLIAGTVWPTASKPDGHPLLGTGGLRQIVEVAGAPVLAIGGIDASRLEAVASTGASGVAAIGAWMSDEPGCRARGLHAVARTFRGGRDLANMDIPFPRN